MNVQNAKNLTITEGSVKTIHDKDNRLLWGAVGYDTKYAGDITQQTYSGKNLFDVSNISAISSATTITTIDNGWEQVTTSSGYGSKITITSLSPSTTYTLSWNISIVSGSPRLAVWKGTGQSASYITVNGIAEGTGSTSFTTDADGTSINIWFYNAVPGAGDTKWTFVQLEKSASATSYEPFVGGTASPNPDYPQDINVVTGEQTVKVTGKNLLNPQAVVTDSNDATVYITSDGQWIRFQTGGKPLVINNPEQKAGAFTLTAVVKSGVDTSNVIGFTAEYSDGTTENTDAVSTTDMNEHTVTFTSNGSKTLVSLTSRNTWVKEAFLKIVGSQLENGSTATAYEAYQGATYTVDLGNTELCKIGNYQDYIYKSGDDWYVHKEIGKVVLDGSEGYWGQNSGNTFYFRSFSDMKVITPSSVVSPLVSNYYIGCSQDDLANATVDYGIALRSSTNGLAVRNKDVTGENAIKNWFQSNNTTVYYALATPTDTKITDSTLIGQLNAIHEWLVRYGYYGAVSTSSSDILPLEILQTLLT